MALLKDTEKHVEGFDQPLIASKAYWKVQHVFGGKARIEVKAEAFHNEVIIAEFKTSFAPTMDGGNFIQQAYEHLKTLPEFSGAEDA